MQKNNTHRLLVAVDGSDRSIQTVQYLADISSFRTNKVNLFNVFNKIPESYYDLAIEPASFNPTSSVRAWESQQHEHIEKHMSKCRQLLLTKDFQPKLVTTTLHNRRVGIARDIIAEARRGYDALVLRRRGMGRFQGLVMGSVAFKLLDGVGFMPLIFAGRKTFNNRILVAVDGSSNAMRAVEFVADKLKGGHCRIRLLNVLRSDGGWGKISKDDLEVQDNIDNAETQIPEAIEKARMHLIAMGFSPDSVSKQIIKDAPSRAAAVVQAAADGNFSTIVLGRKGKSRVREFTIGRVSSKVLQGGREFGVWIVH